MGSRRELLLAKLAKIEEGILALEGGSKRNAAKVKASHTFQRGTTTLLDPLDTGYHGSGPEDFKAVKAQITEIFGAPTDSEEDKEARAKDFVDEMGDANFYTFSILMELDETPGSDIVSTRSRLQLVLLPLFQIVVPFAMVWFFIVHKRLIEVNGYCNDHGSPIFRFTGFVTFIYSAWQIIDGDNDPSSKFMLRHSVKQFALTGSTLSLRATIYFYLANLSQQVSALAILILTYVIYATQCDTSLDLVMNCVAINFVLGIDSEWMNPGKTEKARASAKVIFTLYRDMCHKCGDEDEVREGMKSYRFIRGKAPQLVEAAQWIPSTIIWVTAYFLAVGWTFCPPHM